MSEAIEFALLPLSGLRPHERVVDAKVRALVRELRRSGAFVDPIWVDRATHVILNGHHRAAAARRLGIDRIPAWVVAYDSPQVRLERWAPGPPISKAEVVRRAVAGDLFPPRTTRHRIDTLPPARSVPLSELRDAPRRGADRPRRGPTRTQRPRPATSPPG